MSIWNQTKNISVCSSLIVAESLFERTQGLLGKKSFPQEACLWIHHCSMVHTFL